MHHQHIVIVGAGIVGLSTAYALLKQGMKQVTILEQATVDHDRAASHGLSKLLRFEYGADTFYSEMVRLSLKYWKNLEHITRRTLYTQTGVLVLGNENDLSTWSSYNGLKDLGLLPERFTHRSCIQRFPQFDTQAYDMLIYNTEGGMLHASTCLQTLKECIIELGGKIVENYRVTHVTHENKMRPIRLHLATGGEIVADRVVLATGPWVHKLLDNLQLPIRLTRQYLLYFANLPTSSFSATAFPAFLAGDLYGFPLHNTCAGSGPAWLKAASHRFGRTTTTDEIPVVDKDHISQVTADLYALIPALQMAELAHIDSCIYDVSFDENFILDHLPDDPRIVFATGLTGHGFKFGLLLGEILSDLVRETEPVVSMKQFQLARFTHQWGQHAHSVA